MKFKKIKKFSQAKQVLKRQMKDATTRLDSNPLNASANAKYKYAELMLNNLKTLKDYVNEGF